MMAKPGIIDFHTHAFPPEVAASAIPALEKEGNVKAYLDGTIEGLLKSMDGAGITSSVICSIATRVEQFGSILKWSELIGSERIIPFPSVHPADPDFEEHLYIVAQRGFKGIKLHPFYQDFYLAEKRMDSYYEVVQDLGLLLVMHTGHDIAFPREHRCGPAQVLQVLDRFPHLKLITTHLGAWDQWEDVEKLLEKIEEDDDVQNVSYYAAIAISPKI